jgi:hypothetical protein
VGKVGAKRCRPALPDRRHTSPLPARYIRHKYKHAEPELPRTPMFSEVQINTVEYIPYPLRTDDQD